MKVNFTPGPSATIAAVPSFGSFDGATRHCVKNKPAKGGVMRCAEYSETPGSPTTRGLDCKNLRSTGGARWKGLRPSKAGCGKRGAPRKARRTAKRHAKRRARK